MIKRVACFGILLLAGCATYEEGGYRPRSAREKKAFARISRSVTPNDVREDFHALRNSEVAWAGIIKEIQFKEVERAIQVAFFVEHRHFDWTDKPYRLSAEGEGEFVAGQSVDKPVSISRLEKLARPGDMLVAYGTPFRIRDGVIQLRTSSVRPIPKRAFSIAGPED